MILAVITLKRFCFGCYVVVRDPVSRMLVIIHAEKRLVFQNLQMTEDVLQHRALLDLIFADETHLVTIIPFGGHFAKILSHVFSQ